MELEEKKKSFQTSFSALFLSQSKFQIAKWELNKHPYSLQQ